MTSTEAFTRDDSLTRTAVLLAAATVLIWFVLAAMDHDGAGWMIPPVAGIATALTAWRAGGRSPQNMRAFVALMIGVLAVLVFVGFVVTGG